MASYVVAGATGRVGSVVAHELLSRGVSVTVIVRSEQARTEWRNRGASVAVGSLDDETFLTTVFAGTDAGFVLLPENVDPANFHGARRQMADAIAGAVSASGIPHVVMLSAVAAVLPDGNGPAKDLHYLENRLASTTARCTILRSAYFQDNVGGMVGPARHAGIYPNFMPSDEFAFPMIATTDVGRFAADALLAPRARSETVLLAGPSYTPQEVAIRLGGALGKPVHVVGIPPEQQVGALVGAGLPEQLAEAVVEMMAAFGKGLIRPTGDRTLMGMTTIDETIGRVLNS
jgi:uncharacterized protein YbjT (DUF2867 family)